MITLVEEDAPWTFTGEVAVVDTSVLVDFALQTAARHLDAVLVVRRLIESRVRIRAPFHAAFEFAATIRRCIRLESAQHATHASREDVSLVATVHAVPINSAFVDHYTMLDLPHLRASDLIFLALARADAAVLITEDDELFRKAAQIGARCFKMKEYIAQAAG